VSSAGPTCSARSPRSRAGQNATSLSLRDDTPILHPTHGSPGELAKPSFGRSTKNGSPRSRRCGAVAVVRSARSHRSHPPCDPIRGAHVRIHRVRAQRARSSGGHRSRRPAEAGASLPATCGSGSSVSSRSESEVAFGPARDVANEPSRSDGAAHGRLRRLCYPFGFKWLHRRG